MFNLSLQEGRGVAYYEIGVYDNGDLIGITEEQCIESIMVLYYMARSIEAEI